MDKTLPFGLHSAPKLFSTVADGLAWALQCMGVANFIHYLDDFLFWGPSDSPICDASLGTATNLFARLGLPTAQAKLLALPPNLPFRGIEIDLVSQQLTLPPDKLSCLHTALALWVVKRNVS